jgi:hypothetical protein
MWLTRRPYVDFHILAEIRQKLHQTDDREGAGASAHEAGNVRLPDAENFPGLNLREAALLDCAVDLQG